MTPRKLNQDIAKLYKKCIGEGIEMSKDRDLWNQEFRRLHGADSSFKYMSHKSLKMMMKMQSRFRFMQFSGFMLSVEV